MNSSNRKTTDYYRSRRQGGGVVVENTVKQSQTKMDTTFRRDLGIVNHNERQSLSSSKIDEPQISLDELLNSCEKQPSDK